MTRDDRCKGIELILSDVDGVMTDGGIIYDTHGVEIKRFHVRDGLGIKLWQKAGFRFGILTSRSSQSVRLRAAELGVDLLRQGCEEKLPAAQQIMQELRLKPAQVCYIGDDLPDLAGDAASRLSRRGRRCGGRGACGRGRRNQAAWRIRCRSGDRRDDTEGQRDVG